MGIGIVVSDRDEKHFKKGESFETLSVDQFNLESRSLRATVVYKIREKKYGNLAGVWHRIGIRMSAPFPEELIKKFQEVDLAAARPRSIDFLSEDFKIAVEQEIESAQKRIKNNSAVAKYLLQLEISRQKDQYISEHVKVLSYISTYIARSMNWITDLTMQKLIYASHLHDAPLMDHPHLAKMIYLRDFEKAKNKLSSEEQNIYMSAPQEAYLIVLDDKKAPPDVDVMLLMQKELPSGKGFPKKHNSTKIPPMAAVFIIAHDLAHEMVTNPNWSIDEWLGRVKPLYKGGSFTKVMDAIENHRFAFKK
jgi:HD-GYP domain-containing protein (c-di-GMP phosphodiesterase class II)